MIRKNDAPDESPARTADVTFSYENVYNVIKLNQCECWPLDDVVKHLNEVGPDGAKREDRLTALWLIFSFANHSCEQNTNRFTIGNFLFLIATTSIAKGEEVTTSYIPLD
jgi:hypothetical protein